MQRWMPINSLLLMPLISGVGFLWVQNHCIPLYGLLVKPHLVNFSFAPEIPHFIGLLLMHPSVPGPTICVCTSNQQDKGEEEEEVESGQTQRNINKS